LLVLDGVGFVGVWRRSYLTIALAGAAFLSLSPWARLFFYSSSRRRAEALFNGRMAGHPEPRFLVVALPPACRLCGGRFDRLPPLMTHPYRAWRSACLWERTLCATATLGCTAP